ncbi:MAG TPA: ATP-binding cassette domain-containing protein, partial [bacterium]|nr:ATP-binding cassette domain-containing protein [bacterium]
MLSISNLTKSYGRQLLFDGASLHMSQGERLGLMGRNGHGKTTLFRIILGVEEPDGGSIEMPRGYRIGHLEQHLRWQSPTVLEVACEGLGIDAENERYRAEEILFGLGFCREELSRPPQELSGGFGVRLNLARTLVSEPS